MVETRKISEFLTYEKGKIAVTVGFPDGSDFIHCGIIFKNEIGEMPQFFHLAWHHTLDLKDNIGGYTGVTPGITSLYLSKLTT